jgi:hypothetical protein
MTKLQAALGAIKDEIQQRKVSERAGVTLIGCT